VRGTSDKKSVDNLIEDAAENLAEKIKSWRCNSSEIVSAFYENRKFFIYKVHADEDR
jgi:hypothetical protein